MRSLSSLVIACAVPLLTFCQPVSLQAEEAPRGAPTLQPSEADTRAPVAPVVPVVAPAGASEAPLSSGDRIAAEEKLRAEAEESFARRDDIIGPDGEPIDLRGFTPEERRRIVAEHYPSQDPAKALESLRKYADYLHRNGRISDTSWERIQRGRTCMFGPSPAPRGMTRDRLNRILSDTAELPAAEQWARIMSESPVDQAMDPNPLMVVLPAPDGPNCVGFVAE